MDVAIRAAGPAFLREMQYLALFVPPGADNPAMRLHERHGFSELRREGDSVSMLRVRPDPATATVGH